MSASLLLLASCVGLTTLPQQGVVPPDDTGSQQVGELSVDATSVAFGEVEIGTTAEHTLTLTNTGSSALDVSLSVYGDAFDVSTSTVSVDDTQVVDVIFAPATEGPYEGELTVIVGSETLVIPLMGDGVEEGGGTDTDDTDTNAGAGALSITPASHDFGEVNLDDTETATFTVSNTGSEDLLISDVQTSAGVWTTGGTLSPPQVLSPGSNKLLEVSFTPTAETTYSGTITLVSDDTEAPEVDIAVEGEGVDLCDICSPLIDVDTGADPYAITDFFSLFGSTDTRTITIQNVGDMDLEVTDVLVNNDTLASCGSFTVGGWGAAETLGPYETTSFTISYRASESCLEVAQAAFDMNVAHILSDDPSQGDWIIELSGAGL